MHFFKAAFFGALALIAAQEPIGNALDGDSSSTVSSSTSSSSSLSTSLALNTTSNTITSTSSNSDSTTSLSSTSSTTSDDAISSTTTTRSGVSSTISSSSSSSSSASASATASTDLSSSDIVTAASTDSSTTGSTISENSTQASTSASANAVARPRVRVAAATAQTFTTAGCYADFYPSSRAMTGLSTTSNTLTNDQCASFCGAAGYTYSGTEFANECYCSNTLPTVSSEGCNTPCAGDAGQTCGGSNAISVSTVANPATAPEVYELGCYADTVYNRAIPEGFYATDSMTIDQCRAYCAGQSRVVFGLEYANQCFCGDAVPSQGVSMACNMPCAGDSTEICGGPDALSVFTTDADIYEAVTDLQGATYDAVGCFADYYPSSRALSGPSTRSDTLTPQACATFCALQGYSIFGVEYSSECYCAMELPTETSTACSMPCSGDGSETCGGNNALNVYRFAAGTTPVPSTTTTTSSTSTTTTSSTSASSSTTTTSSSETTTSSSTTTTSSTTSIIATAPTQAVSIDVEDWQYKGCQSDLTSYRNLDQFSFSSSSMTVETCLSTCVSRGFVVAGVEFASECYCGNALRFDSISSSCTMACAGNSLETCGGPNALSVYTYTGTVRPASTKASVTSSNGKTYNYGGCWRDTFPYRVLNGASTSTSAQSVELCAEYCSTRGYSMFGLEFYGECYCGNELVGSQPATEASCNAPCAQNTQELCGGSNVLSVYGTSSVANKPYPKSAPAQKLRYKGHDISSLLMLEDGVNAKYQRVGWTWNQQESNNPPKTFEQLLADAGSNTIRLRLWTSPDPNNFDGTTYGLKYNIDLARRAIASGQKIMLDPHFSDNWADPGKQVIPRLWQGLDEAGLLAKVQEYTTKVLNRFADEGLPVEILTTGNEIRNGMLWPYGGSVQGPNFGNLAKIHNAIVAGTRASYIPTKPQLMIHSDGGASRSGMQYFFGSLFSSGLSSSDVQIIGLTWYPFYSAADTQASALDSFTYLAQTYGLPIHVVETNWPLQCSNPSSMRFAVDLNINQSDPNAIPFTAQGQKTWLYMVSEVLSKVPNGLGQGLMYWESGWSNLTSLGTSCEQLTMIQDYWYNYDATAEGEYSPTCLCADSINAFRQL